MKMKVFYQDFYINHAVLDKDKLVLDVKNAVFIREIDSSAAVKILSLPEEKIDKQEMARTAMRIMNNLDVPEDHPDRQLFEQVRHTSMSVGDFVMFEDNEIWVVWLTGWKIFPPKKVSESLKASIMRSFQDEKKANELIAQIEAGSHNLTPCTYPMNQFYNYMEEVPDGTRVSEMDDCLSCEEKDCEERYCLIVDPIQDRIKHKRK
jgi:hypothetical protein